MSRAVVSTVFLVALALWTGAGVVAAEPPLAGIGEGLLGGRGSGGGEGGEAGDQGENAGHRDGPVAWRADTVHLIGGPGETQGTRGRVGCTGPDRGMFAARECAYCRKRSAPAG